MLGQEAEDLGNGGVVGIAQADVRQRDHWPALTSGGGQLELLHLISRGQVVEGAQEGLAVNLGMRNAALRVQRLEARLANVVEHQARERLLRLERVEHHLGHGRRAIRARRRHCRI